MKKNICHDGSDGYRLSVSVIKGQNDSAALVPPSPKTEEAKKMKILLSARMRENQCYKLFIAQTNVYTSIFIIHVLQIYIYIIITHINTKLNDYSGVGYIKSTIT